MLKTGSRGEDVTELQSQLNELGYELDVDGVFGRETEAAVRHLQSSFDLGVDGIVGPKTRSTVDGCVAGSWTAADYDASEWYADSEEEEGYADDESEEEE
jgi:peptidoglycan hydrolase-like protein with peptidoglycan-binding domain